MPAKIRLMKFIRLTMSAAFSVLQKLDNVRIIHLVRDPRAMMDSQLRKDDMGVSHFETFVERTIEMCRHMRNDLRVAGMIETKFPGVIYPLRYEDMVSDPLAVAKEIFEFIDEEFIETVEKYVLEKSIESDHNSTARESVWREHITEPHLKAVDKYCGDLYETLGYIPLNTVEEIRDTNIRTSKIKV